jgi:hypothetical protein
MRTPSDSFGRSRKNDSIEMIPLGERHFRRAITEFVEHYHLERNHQGLDNRLITGTPVADAAARVRRRSRLGGFLNYYEACGVIRESAEMWNRTRSASARVSAWCWSRSLVALILFAIRRSVSAFEINVS